ncbi:MAG: type II secretion system F family protein, partial [Thermodesulfobacteriota bacterium]
MPVFVWKGTASNGEIQKGEIEAQDEQAARRLLRHQRISPSNIKIKSKDLSEYIGFLKKKVPPKDIVVFTRQLSTMIDAGLPLVQGLGILASQQENKTFKKILQDVKTDIESGFTFADALKKHPKQFDRLFCNMIAAGEMGGILDDVLQRLANYMEKALRLKRKVKGALTYPIIVLSISVLVLGIILIFVIPVFEQMFADFGKALPVPTQMVVNLSNFVKSYFLVMIGSIAGMVFLLRKYYNTEKGRRV